MFLLALVPCIGACGSSDGDGDSNSDDNAWVGRTYLLDIPSENWSEPRQIGAEIGDFVPQFLIGVQDPSRDEFGVLVGTAQAGMQDRCTSTALFDGTAEPYPSQTIGPDDLRVRIQHVSEDISIQATIHSLTLTNVLPAGDDTAEDGELTAIVDGRELYPLFTMLINPTPDTLCAALASFSTCGPCPSDGASYCLSLKAQGLRASEITDARVEAVTASELDPGCFTVEPGDTSQ